MTKKNVATVLIMMIMITSSIIAQSNITWKIKDNLQKGQIARTLTLNSSFTGFSSGADVQAFFQKMKAYDAFSSCELVSSNSNSCDLKLQMKQFHEKSFYTELAIKMGITTINVNGVTKTVQELTSKK